MTNVAKLSLELNIGAQTIIPYLNHIGVKNPSLNTKLSESIIKKVIDNFKNKDVTLKQSTQFLLSDNIFTKVIQKISYKGEKTIDSYFTDEQAKEICSKMAVGKIRYYSNLFFPKRDMQKSVLNKLQDRNWELLKYQIHYIATKALDFYGNKILTFIYKLRCLPINNKTTEVLSANKLWYRSEDICFPTFQLNRLNDSDNYYIRFTKMYERKQANFPVFYISNYRRRNIASFSRNGELITKFKERFPSIAIFEEIINGKLTLYSGYDSGFCDICGLKLEDPLSVSYGRGPKCRNTYPL